MIDIYNGDSLLPIDEDDDILVCSECGSPEVASLAFVGVNDQIVDFESLDINTTRNNYCMDCQTRSALIPRRDFLEKMNAWWDSLPIDTQKLLGVTDPFARHWSSLLYYEKREIYLAQR